MHQQYVWLSLYIDRSLRNGKVCKNLIRYVISDLRGLHGIHFFPTIRSFSECALADLWEYIGRSQIFEECDEYECWSEGVTIKRPKLLAGIQHTMYKSRPVMPSIASRKDAARAMLRVREYYGLV